VQGAWQGSKQGMDRRGPSGVCLDSRRQHSPKSEFVDPTKLTFMALTQPPVPGPKSRMPHTLSVCWSVPHPASTSWHCWLRRSPCQAWQPGRMGVWRATAVRESQWGFLGMRTLSPPHFQTQSSCHQTIGLMLGAPHSQANPCTSLPSCLLSNLGCTPLLQLPGHEAPPLTPHTHRQAHNYTCGPPLHEALLLTVGALSPAPGIPTSCPAQHRGSWTFHWPLGETQGWPLGQPVYRLQNSWDGEDFPARPPALTHVSKHSSLVSSLRSPE
jgi:hypothetical protein